MAYRSYLPIGDDDVQWLLAINMDGDGRQGGEEDAGRLARARRFVSRFNQRQIRQLRRQIRQLLALIISAFLILLLVVSVPGFEVLLDYLDSAIPRLSLGYDSETRLQVALRLMQVAVLYFAVLVAAFRFMDSSDRFSVKRDRLLFLAVWLAFFFVSVSAFLSVVSSFKLFTEPSFVGALLSMAAGFLVSVLTPVLAFISEGRGHEGRSTESSTEQTESGQHETDHDGTTRDADRRGGGTVHGHSAGLRREREG